MSNTLRRYISVCPEPPPDVKHYGVNEPMDITAFVGGGGVPCMQFTIGNHYCCLAPNQMRELIHSMMYRMYGKEGYRATDSTETKVIYGTESPSRKSRRMEKDAVKALNGNNK